MSFPPIAELVPHAGPMALLTRVLEHSPEQTRCLVAASQSRLFAESDGRIAPHVALEWMAQCIAVHGGLIARAAAEPGRPGLFLGSRKASLPTEPFSVTDEFEVTARLARGRGVGPHAFHCTLQAAGGTDILGEGTLNVMIYENMEALTSPAEGAGAWR